MSDPQQQSSAPVPLNPECEAGKHGSCFMDAWDYVEDVPTLCECPCH